MLGTLGESHSVQRLNWHIDALKSEWRIFLGNPMIKPPDIACKLLMILGLSYEFR